jgi:hypothetical protein
MKQIFNDLVGEPVALARDRKDQPLLGHLWWLVQQTFSTTHTPRRHETSPP